MVARATTWVRLCTLLRWRASTQISTAMAPANAVSRSQPRVTARAAVRARPSAVTEDPVSHRLALDYLDEQGRKQTSDTDLVAGRRR